MKKAKYVGLDVHKDTIVIAIAEEGRDGEIRPYGTIRNDVTALAKTVRKLEATGATLRFVYEAGPTGFVIWRYLTGRGLECIVVAPSKTPKGSGEKVKTDRRDAASLARLHRAGELTAIHVPDARDEAIRDLCRARTDAVQDRTRVRHRLKAFLLRQGHSYAGKASWSEAHKRYLRELKLTLPGHQEVLEEYLSAIDEAEERVKRYESMLERALESWRMQPVVKALMCLRGFGLVVAMGTVAEIGDARRFDHPRQMMGFLGLVPSEHSSGTSRRQGGITRTGNPHARWLLCEAAIHYRMSPKVSRALGARQDGQPVFARQIGWKAQQRLHGRWRRLAARRLHAGKLQTAIARELSGFVWDLMGQALARLPEEMEKPKV